MKPKILVLRTAGTNCDEETGFAFARAGGDPAPVHIARLIEKSSLLADFQILCLPGGFSYGDDLSAGKILANQLSIFLQEEILRFIDKGGLVLGICNGFQALVKAGILPGMSRPWRVEATLAANESGRFEARWVSLACPSSVSVFMRGMSALELPVAHAEGRFVPADPEVLSRLRTGRQIALCYTTPDETVPRYPGNPSGSVEGIAGISDPTGRVLGLMPHPERHVFRRQHPAAAARRWAALAAPGSLPPFEEEEGEGLQVFRNAVDSVK